MNGLEQLEREIGEGPPHRPIEDRLIAGRSAVRRRQALLAAPLMAAVVVGIAVLLGGGGDTTATIETPIATQSTPTPTPVPTPAPEQRRTKDHMEAVVLKADGTLDVARGARVVRTLPNPLGYQPPEQSIGVELTFRGETYWQLHEYSPGSGGVSSDPAGKGFATLEEWIEVHANLQKGIPEDPVAELLPNGKLRPLGDTQIVEARYDVKGMTAVAEVLHKGSTAYIVVHEGVVTLVSVAEGGPNLDAFVEYARQAYASGEGLR